jgi:hypothetical protein
MSSATANGLEADVVLSDGGSAHVRPIRAEDKTRLRAFSTRVSGRAQYLRFFAPVLSGVVDLKCRLAPADERPVFEPD